MRLHSSRSEAPRPEAGDEVDVLGHRCHESQASPLDATQPEPGVCSNSHQSLLTFPPSIWCAEVATPQGLKPGGKVSVVPVSGIGGKLPGHRLDGEGRPGAPQVRSSSTAAATSSSR